MVRVKKRYFVVLLERASEVPASGKRRLFSSEIKADNAALAKYVQDLVGELYGDHGRAACTRGLRTIYANSTTGMVLIVARHGPHKMVASALPFITKICGERVVPRLIYTGATVRKCYKVMEAHQIQELREVLQEVEDEGDKKIIEEKMLALRQLD